MSRVQSWCSQAWLLQEAEPGDGECPSNSDSSVPHLGALPIPFNEPHVSLEQEAIPWPSPLPCPCPFLSLFVPLSPFLDYSRAPPLPTTTPFPSLFPTLPPGAQGLGSGVAHTSRSHCLTICFCLHLVGRRQERSERLMRHCAAGLLRGRAGGGQASQPW